MSADVVDVILPCLDEAEAATSRHRHDEGAELVVAAPARDRLVGVGGAHRSWLPDGGNVITQRGDGLDERIRRALQEALAPLDHGPALQVGMDTPQLRVADLGLDWDGADAVLGLSPDGGYWALGLRHFHPDVVKGVPMATGQTGRRQLARLQSLGFRVRVLPMMRDVDSPADAAKVARIAPDGRFGRLHRRITGLASSPMALYDEALGGAEVDVCLTLGAREVQRGRLPAGSWQQMAPADEILLSRC